MTAGGRITVITGALGGMGWATAQRLARSHRSVLLTDIDKGRLDDAVNELNALGVESRGIPCDLSDASSIVDLAAAVDDAGGLRALVHTAAVSPTMADWKQVLTVDLVGTASLLESLFPMTGAGSVAVCFASVAAHMGRPISGELMTALDEPLHGQFLERVAAAAEGDPDSSMAYIWAKVGIVRLCERLSVPWGARGARILSLSPGLMDTPMGRFELERNPAKLPLMSVTPLHRERAAGQSPLPGRAEDIAAAVDYLCSDDASFITGCDLRVDGGFIGAWRWAQNGSPAS